MFLDNKYTKWYKSIVSSAQIRVNLPGTYLERHHIVPRCLGGSNAPANLVDLTAREHFICHLLLVRMTTGCAKRSMAFAVWAICKLRHAKLQPLRVRSKTYERIRTDYAVAQSQCRKGKLLSQETRAKISRAKTGKPLSPAAIAAIRIGIIQRYKNAPVTQQTRDKISKIHRGKVLSKETRTKIGAASKNRRQSGWFEWVLIDPTGNTHTIIDLKRFCHLHDLPWKSISHSLNGKPVSRGRAKGWLAISKRRPTSTQ